MLKLMYPLLELMYPLPKLMYPLLELMYPLLKVKRLNFKIAILQKFPKLTYPENS